MAKAQDTRLDVWLDKHPRLDDLYTRQHIRLWRRVRQVQWLLDVEGRRYYHSWKIGVTYLDHGYEPCVLVERDDYDGLTGISMVDGRVVGGCSIYHCGPEIVPLAEARKVAQVIQQMQEAGHGAR